MLETPKDGGLTGSKSLADVKNEHNHQCLEKIREKFLTDLKAGDVVHGLLARRVLTSTEMTTVLKQPSQREQSAKLIDVLKTKSDWWGPLTTSLFRSGYPSLAEELLKMSTNNNVKNKGDENCSASTSNGQPATART